MSKIRINELARELEVKPSAILELLPDLGIADKKTHSSSLEDDQVLLVRRRLGGEAAVEEAARRESFAVPVLDYESPIAENGVSEPAPAPVPAPPPVVAAAPPVETPKEIVEAPASFAPVRPLVAPVRPPLASGTGTGPSGTGQPIAPPLAAPGPRGIPIPAKPGPPPPRPGQILSGPRQPLPPGLGQMAKAPLSPGTPAPPPPRYSPASHAPSSYAPTSPSHTPGAPSHPAPSIPAPRPAMRPPGAPSAGNAPGQTGHLGQPGHAGQPGHTGHTGQQQPPAGGGMPLRPPAKPNLAGQPALRPVVPPRPDLVAKLTRPAMMPGAPLSPRPGMPSRPSSPVPGRPIYTGPVRPGQPLMRGPGGPPGPGGPGGPAGLRGRGRPMHPTSPLRAEPATMPTDPGRRHATKPGARDRRREPDQEEGRLRPMARRHEAFEPPPVDREITIAEGITVKELSEKLGVKGNLVVKRLMEKKIFATINQTLDVKLAEELARDFGASTNKVSYEQETTHEIEQAEVDKDRERRPPVVTIMGHVDHGKTSLLDAIRSANVAGEEAGGITQHIGAYHVEKNGKNIVFIDTPGHEAFTRMRARGAKVTDIVVLVVAADDGVMPQTLEAIDHAKAAKVPIIVAINKIDKPDAQPERIKQQLADRGLLAEDWGGDVVMVPVSARTKTNLDLLLEMILLVADMQDLKANPARPAMGTVLEAKLDRGRGPVATVLVRNGTLQVGDYFICRLGVRARARHVRRSRRADARSRPLDARRSDRAGIASRGRRHHAGGDRHGQGQADRHLSRVQGARSGDVQDQPHHARPVARSAQGRRDQGAQHHSQDRRGRHGGSADRHAAEAVQRQGQDPRAALGRGRDHRNRRAAGVGLRTRSSSASTSGRSATRRPWRSRKRSISGCTRSFTSWPTRSSAP